MFMNTGPESHYLEEEHLRIKIHVSLDVNINNSQCPVLNSYRLSFITIHLKSRLLATARICATATQHPSPICGTVFVSLDNSHVHTIFNNHTKCCSTAHM